jgi:ABC-type dipeptide/oligopeptide/nickel transport system permease subunit
MSTVVEDIQPVPSPAEPVAARRRRPRLNGRLRLGLGLLTFVILLAIFGPLVSRYGTAEIVASDALSGPSGAHWLGADNFGRDMFVRMAAGYRSSLEVAVCSVAIGLLAGVPLGLLAGYGGSVADNAVMRPLDIVMAFPGVLLAIVVMAIFGTGLAVLMLAIGIVYVPIIARVMRAATLETAAQLYVEAARARGASHRRIVLRHVLPNSLGPVIVQASILLGIAVLLESALSFIGIGVRPPTPSLGVMLAEGRDFMSTSTWVVAVPGLGLMLLVLTFNLIGDGLHSWLDPRGKAGLR